jgi:hypothetical protein
MQIYASIFEQSRLARNVRRAERTSSPCRNESTNAGRNVLPQEWLRPYGKQTQREIRKHIESSFEGYMVKNRNRLPDMEERLRELSAIVK